MERLRTLLLGFARDNRGATAIEYGLIAVGVSMSVIIGGQEIGRFVRGVFEAVQTGLNP